MCLQFPFIISSTELWNLSVVINTITSSSILNCWVPLEQWYCCILRDLLQSPWGKPQLLQWDSLSLHGLFCQRRLKQLLVELPGLKQGIESWSGPPAQALFFPPLTQFWPLPASPLQVLTGCQHCWKGEGSFIQHWGQVLTGPKPALPPPMVLWMCFAAPFSTLLAGVMRSLLAIRGFGSGSKFSGKVQNDTLIQPKVQNTER